MSTTRSVRVTLSASTGQYIREMQRAGTETAKALSVAERASGQFAAKYKRDMASAAAAGDRFVADQRGDLHRAEQDAIRAGDKAGRGYSSSAKRALIAAGGIYAAADFARDSVQLEAEFGKTMLTLGAVADVPKQQIGELSDLALQLGADTSFSASEASGAMLELAKGGLSAATIEAGALKGTLDLAAAGGTDLGKSAEIASNALNIFSLRGQDMGAVADALAGGANASTASIESLGTALGQVGGTSAATGLSLNDTVGVLAAFDQAGIKGSDAGTSLKNMLSSLTPQTESAAAAIDRLGLKFTNADGSFRSITNIADQLQDKLGGLSAAERSQTLQTIFGSDARRAANVLVNEGAEGLAKYIRQTEKAGSAQKVADERLSGTAGSLERLRGSIETLKLRGGIALAPLVSDLADAAGPKLDKLGDWFEKDGADSLARFGGYLKDDVLPPARDLGRELGPIAQNTLPLLADGLQAGATAAELLAPPVTAILKAFGDLPKSAQQALILAGGVGMLRKRMDGVGGRGGTATLTGLALAGLGDRAETAGGKAERAGGKLGGLKGLLRSGITTVGLAVGIQAVSGAIDDLGSSVDRGDLDKIEAKLNGAMANGTGARGPGFGKRLRESFGLAGMGEDAKKLGIDLDRLARDMAENGTKGDYYAEVMEKIQARQKDALKLKTWPNPFGDSIFDRASRFEDHLADVAGAWGDATKAAKGYQDLVALYNPKLPQPDKPAGGRQVNPLEVSSDPKIRDVFSTLPKEVKVKVTTPGAVQSKRDVLALARQFKLTPKQVETVMEALDFASPQIKRVKERLSKRNLKDRDLYIRGKGIDKTRGQVDALGVDVGRSLRDVGEVKTKATGVSETQNAVTGMVDVINTALGDRKLKDQGVNIALTPQAASVMTAAEAILPIFKRATGGPIAGPGTGTSDDIPAWLSNGEHVLTAREVQAAGGHKVIEQMRRMMLAGQASQLVETPQYRDGGAVVPSASMSGLPNATAGVDSLISGYVRDLSATVSDKVSKALIAAGGRDFDVSGLSGVSDRVTLDGEPLTRITKAQILLAERLSGIAMRVMQGSFQPATSYSGTSHTGPGVADLGPGNFAAQGALRQVALASWGRNFPGAKTAGSGAHTHNVSLLDPGSRNNGQATAFKAGGDGLGGRDYGPNPRPIPGLMMGLRAMGVGLATGGPVEYAGVRDSGGLFPTGSFVANTSGRTEWVLPPDQARHYATGGAVTRSANLVSAGSTAAGNLPWAIAQNTAALTRATAATAANTSATRNQPTVAQASSSLTAERRRQGDVGRAQAGLEAAQDRYSDAASNRATGLDILNQRRTIRDLSKELNAKGKDRLKGTLNRQIAKAELAEAKAELARMQRSRGDLDRARAALEAAKRNRGRYGSTAAEEQRLAAAEGALEAAQARATAAAEAAQAKAESISQSASDIRSSADLSNLESLSTGSVDRLLATSTANLADFITVMGDLKAANAAPWLLQQLQAAGPTRAAIRLGRQYLSDTSRLATVNARASQYTALSQQWGQMVNDPRWAAGGAWQPNTAATRTALYQISMTDTAQQMQQFKTWLRHEMQTLMPAGEV